MILSAILFIGVAGFITMYLSTFMTNVTPTTDFVNDLSASTTSARDQTISLNAGLTGYGDDKWPYNFYSASHGMASMIVTTLVLLGPTLLMLRRWRVPVGAFTLIFLGFGLLVNIMTEYRDIVLIIPLILTGVASTCCSSGSAASRRAAHARRHPHRRPGRGGRPVDLLLRGARARQGHRLGRRRCGSARCSWAS